MCVLTNYIQSTWVLGNYNIIVVSRLTIVFMLGRALQWRSRQAGEGAGEERWSEHFKHIIMSVYMFGILNFLSREHPEAGIGTNVCGLRWRCVVKVGTLPIYSENIIATELIAYIIFLKKISVSKLLL